MVKLKTKYESQDDIPEAFRELYEEKDGKFILVGVEGANDGDGHARLAKQRDVERNRANAAELKLKRFEALADRDPADLLKAIEDVDDLRQQLDAASTGKDGKGEDAIRFRIETAVNREKAKLQRELDKALKAIEEQKALTSTLDGRIRASTIQGALTKIAVDLKVKPEAVGDVLLHQSLFELDEDGKGVRTRDGVGVTPGIDPATWLADRKTDKPHWWPESVGGGAIGGRGGSGPPENPFAKGSFNLTKAGRLMQTDMAKATAYAKAAGFASPDAAIRAAASVA